MQIQVDIGFDQLLKAVKKLPAKQLMRLKKEIEEQDQDEAVYIDLEKLLLSGPTATKKQLEVIEHNTKSINQWRVR